MPKVIVREYDNSTTGLASAANFAVVVPGIMGSPTNPFPEEGIIDDNGIFECKSQALFKEYIGLVGAKTTSTKEAPKLVALDDNATGVAQYYLSADSSTLITDGDGITLSPDDERVLFTEDGADRVIYDNKEKDIKGAVYKLIKDDSVTEDGVLAVKIGSQGYRLIQVNGIKSRGDNDGKVYLETASNGDDNAKVVKGGTYVLVELDAEGNPEIGSTALTAINHRGNQIAYELLGLGYTVLYKIIKIKAASSTKSAEQNTLAQLADPEFWEPLKDKSIYNFRYLTTGGYMDAAAMKCIINVASFDNRVALADSQTFGDANGRGDCIALCDFDESGITDKSTTKKVLVGIKKAVNRISGNDMKYAAIFGPEVYYEMSDVETEPFSGNYKFPGSFHYLACAANAQSKYAEWYAVAGYNRGVPARGIKGTTIKLGEVAINTLAPRIVNDFSTKAVNLILAERGNYYLWGNRTAETLNKSGLRFSHFLNIRQLCTTIKKDLYVACRQFTFDPNSDILWANFVAAIRPTLEKMQGDQGIAGYKITRVKNNTKALLSAKIRIVPIEAVEDFDISIYLEDSLDGITVSADEQEA